MQNTELTVRTGVAYKREERGKQKKRNNRNKSKKKHKKYQKENGEKEKKVEEGTEDRTGSITGFLPKRRSIKKTEERGKEIAEKYQTESSKKMENNRKRTD